MREFTKRVGFIGFGNMAQAIMQGWMMKEVINPDLVYASAHHWPKLVASSARYQIHPLRTNKEVVDKCDIIILAAKPYQLKDALEGCEREIEGKLVISLAAGLTYDDVQQIVPNARHVNIMPNTPIAVGEGIVMVDTKNDLTPDDKDDLDRLFEPVALVESIRADLMGVAGSLAGCTPAFAEMFVEARGDGAVKHGLPRKTAYLLAAKVLEGTGALYLAKKDHPGQMKDAVCSPGGTTIRGVEQLEKEGFRYAVMSALGATMKKD